MDKTSIRNIKPDTLWDAKINPAQTRQTLGHVVTEALEKLVNEKNQGEEQKDATEKQAE